MMSISLYLLLAFPLIFLRPSHKLSVAGNLGQELGWDGNITEYLARYNFLPQSDLETARLRSPEELSRALSDLQYLAGLPETLALDNATRAIIQRPRCGRIDDVVELRRGLGVLRLKDLVKVWSKRSLTWAILHYTEHISVGQSRAAIQDAFKLWQEVTPLQFTEVIHGDATVLRNADIQIKFANNYHQDSYPFDGEGGTVAHAFYPGEPLQGNVHFDDAEVWSSEDSQQDTRQVNLFMVAAHEIGHVLGLRHSNNQESLMYAWYKGYKANVTLSDQDRQQISALYGANGVIHPDVLPLSPQTAPTADETSTLATTISTFNTDFPDGCEPTFDAAALIRKSIFFFKGRFFWKVSQLSFPNPEEKLKEVHSFWYGLPENLTRIDAVYEQPHTRRIRFFIGKKYFEFSGNSVHDNTPPTGRPITDYGLPHDLNKIDAIFVWGHNMMTYIISGNMYWRYDEDKGSISDGYPRDMSIWEGVPLPVDAAFKSWDGRTYFLRGSDYWKFDDHFMKVSEGYPRRINTDWLNCPPTSSTDDKNCAPSRHCVTLATSHVIVMAVLSSVSFFHTLLSSE